MKSYPHPTLEGYFLTTPLYVGPNDAVEKMVVCDHVFPLDLPEKMVPADDFVMGIQKCPKCGAVRSVYSYVSQE